MKVKIGKYRTGRDKRKVSVTIHPHDLYSLDMTLALIIHPALVEMKKCKRGVPIVDPDDSLHFGVDATSFEENESRWEYVIDEMIWGFDQIINGSQFMYNKDLDNRIANSLRLFGKYYTNLWT